MIESHLYQVVKKYRPIIEALAAELDSDAGLTVTPAPALTREQHQKLLFGHLFAGVDQPLKGVLTYKQVPSQTAFVRNLRVIGDMGRDRHKYLTRGTL